MVEAIGQLGDCRGDVVAISIAAQQHGLVVTDEAGVPLRRAKLWNDTESAAEAENMVGKLGAEIWATECGSVPVAAFTITKWAWLARHDARSYRETRRVFLPHDWLTFRLSGRSVTDRGDASGTGWYDAAQPIHSDGPGAFCDRLVGAALDVHGNDSEVERLRALVPEVLGPTEAAGHITAAAAMELGLGADVIVGAGTGDNMAAALALGVGLGDVVFSLGTSGTVYTVSRDRTSDPTGAVAGFADATGCFLPLVCTLNATRVTDTVARWLGTDAPGLADLALGADPGSSSIPELVPYFDGERTPDLPEATGSFTGLRNTTTRAEIALAAHDGVLSGLIAGRDALRRAGAPVDGATLLVGGGSRSSAFSQRLADLIGSAVLVPAELEVVAAGAALQAAVVDLARNHAVDRSVDPGTPGGGALALFQSFARRWGVGGGTLVHPRN